MLFSLVVTILRGTELRLLIPVRSTLFGAFDCVLSKEKSYYCTSDNNKNCKISRSFIPSFFITLFLFPHLFFTRGMRRGMKYDF